MKKINKKNNYDNNSNEMKKKAIFFFRFKLEYEFPIAYLTVCSMLVIIHAA